MSERQQCIELLIDASSFIQKEFGASAMSLFGSIARGEERFDSDVDIYVVMPPKAIKVVALKQYLQKLLGRGVDIIRYHSHLDPFLIDEINRDGVTIFAE